MRLIYFSRKLLFILIMITVLIYFLPLYCPQLVNYVAYDLGHNWTRKIVYALVGAALPVSAVFFAVSWVLYGISQMRK